MCMLLGMDACMNITQVRTYLNNSINFECIRSREVMQI